MKNMLHRIQEWIWRKKMPVIFSEEPPGRTSFLKGLFFLAGLLILLLFVLLSRGKAQELGNPGDILHVQGDNNYPPYEYLENGIPKGFNVEIMQALAREMHLPIHIELDDWNTVRSRLEKGEIDMLMGMYASPLRDLSVDFSTPHIMVTNAFFVRQNSPLQAPGDMYGEHIAVQKGDIMHDHLLKQSITPVLTTVEHPLQALEKVASGECDAALIARLQGLHLAKTHRIPNLRTIPVDILPRKYCIAVPEGRTDLLGRINDGLRILKQNGTYDEIYNHWFGLLEPPQASFQDFLFRSFLLFGPLALLTGILFLWSYHLKIQVQRQTATIQRELEERQNAEGLLRTLINALPDLVCFRDREGRWVKVNQAALKMLHLEHLDYKGRRGSELLPYVPFTFHSFLSADQEDEETWEKGQPLRLDKELFFSDGTSAVFDVLKVPTFDEKGNPRYLVAVARDVTERKTMENSLREKEQHYRTLVENVPGIVFLCGTQPPRKVYHISEEVTSVTGYTPKDFLSSLSWGDLVLPEDLRRLEDAIRNGLHEKRTYTVEYRIRHKDGTLRYVFEKAKGIYSDPELPLYVEGVVLDITERKWAEEEVRRLNGDLEERVRLRTTQLEDTNRELESFAYSISHDLRAPLRAVSGFSQALAEDYEDRLDEQGKDFLKRILRASQRLDQRIQDLLRLSRLGRAEMDRRECSLSKMAQQILKDLEQEEPRENITIEVEDNITAFVDPGLIRVVLENLLHNAWKFTARTPEPRIIFEEASRENKKTPVYCVRDNGAGFPTNQGDRLFGVFQRLHNEADYPGSGIGLATVQRIIHRHGGHIWAEGAEGEGAAFFFTLPDSPRRE